MADPYVLDEDGSPCHLPRPRSQIDNALTRAFREVFGWCPMRDGAPEHERYAQNTKPSGFIVPRHLPRAALPKTFTRPVERW